MSRSCVTLQVELWKNPSVVRHHVDMRVGPRSVTSLLQTLTNAGIPYHVIADDLYKFVFMVLPRDAMHKRVLCRRVVSGWVAVCLSRSCIVSKRLKIRP